VAKKRKSSGLRHYEFTENRPTQLHWGLGDLVKGAEGSIGMNPPPTDEEWSAFEDAVTAGYAERSKPPELTYEI